MSAIFVQGYTSLQVTLGTANTDDTFGSGTIASGPPGVTGGLDFYSVLVSIPGTITAATRIGFAVDDGSIKVPHGSIPIAPYTVAFGNPPRAYGINLPVPIKLKDSTENVKIIIYTSDTVKLRFQNFKYQ